MWQDLVLHPEGKDITLSDFEAICRKNPDLRLEQKATGELVIVALHGGESSNVSSDIAYQLKGWGKRASVGKVFDSNALRSWMAAGYRRQEGMDIHHARRDPTFALARLDRKRTC